MTAAGLYQWVGESFGLFVRPVQAVRSAADGGLKSVWTPPGAAAGEQSHGAA